MSNRRHEVCTMDYKERRPDFVGFMPGKVADGCCSLSCIVILILIILQFSKKRHTTKCKTVDNGILFIIALFFLACCNPCK
jgi:hypothetical protein